MSRRGTGFITVVLFLGIILSCTIFFGVSSFLGFDRENGGALGLEQFDRDFYENEDIRYVVTYCDYKLFRRLNNKNVIVGRDDFLFEIERNGYNFIDDYMGRAQFSENELDVIAKNLSLRKNVYNDLGIEYILAVIPNSQTIYSEKMPFFFKDISPNTRLSQLKKYLLENTDIEPVDTTSMFLRIKNSYPVYNNTENTINSFGAYYLYKEIFRALPASFTKNNVLLEDYIDGISLHYTDGRELARLSGVQSIVKNRTLSIQPRIPYMYETLEKYENVEITSVDPEYREEFLDSTAIVIEYANEWDKLQLAPYFSNTFGTVIYKNYNYNSRVIKNNSVSAVIQIVRESELDSFLDSNIALTYNAGIVEAVPDDVTSTPLMLAKVDADSRTLCIAGRAEEGSVLTIRSTLENKIMPLYGEQFIIGVSVKEGSEADINIFAESDGKKASEPLSVTVTTNPNALPSGVVIGENSRLFDKTLIDRYMKNELYSPIQLAAILRKHEYEHQSIEARNGKKTQFIYLVAPSKINIYSSDIVGYKKSRITKLAQFEDIFKNSSDITIIDLTDTMNDNKHMGPLCYQTDPEWTEVGAYLGYVKLMQLIKKDYLAIDIHKIEEYDISRIYVDGGEYAVMLGLDPVAFSELVPIFSPRFSLRSSLVTYEKDGFRSYQSHIGDDNLPSAVVICDNYGEEIVNFLSEHFKELRVLEVFQKDISDEILKEISPDYVIKVFGEDNLDYFAK